MVSYREKVFISVIALIIFIGFLSFLREQKTESHIENRSLTLFPHMTIDSFMKGEFQTNFENAISDQFIMGETIKDTMNKATELASYSDLNKKVCKGNYVNINDTYAIYDCSKRMVYVPVSYDSKKDKNNEKRIKELKEALKGTDYYVYFINTSANYNFENNEKIYDFSKYFGDNYGEFTFDNYKEYDKYFYKTDHHWNYIGSYKGYREIVDLITDDKPKETSGYKDFKVNFYGSMARMTNVLDFKENFKVYKFDIPDHKEYINGVKGVYGNSSSYLKNEIPNDKFTNHYGVYYGGDDGEVRYEFDNDRENLLILATSYSNAINTLIASHFHNTYVLDMRAYENKMGEKFDYKKYIADKEIDKVLLIGDIDYFSDGDLGLGVNDK